jgi:hypothetical protein
MSIDITPAQAAAFAATILARELGDEHNVHSVTHRPGEPAAYFEMTALMPDHHGRRFLITVQVVS